MQRTVLGRAYRTVLGRCCVAIAGILAGTGIAALPAFAATVSFSVSMTGSAPGATQANGAVTFTPQMAQGTLPPFGPASVVLVNGSTPVTYGVAVTGMIFTLANGSTITSSLTIVDGPNFSYDCTGTITGGTGLFTGATGSYQVVNAAEYTSGGALVYAITGTGTIDAPNVPGGVTVLPASLQLQVATGSNAPALGSVILNNQGLTNVNFTASASVSSAPNWLSVSPASGAAPALSPSSLQVSANPSGLALGVYEGDVTVNESGVSILIPVRLIVGPLGAFLTLSQTGEFFQAAVGGVVPPAVPIQVTNTGAGTLTGLTATTTVTGPGPNWLHASIAPGFASLTQATASISVNPASLAAGMYFGRVDFNMPSAVNSPQSMSVQMQVTPGPLPTVNPAIVMLQSTQNGGWPIPPPQTVTVTNIGTTALSFTVTPQIINGPPGWLTISQTSGILPPGGGTALTFSPIPSCFGTNYSNPCSNFDPVNEIDFIVNFPELNYSYGLVVELMACGIECYQPNLGPTAQVIRTKASAASACTPTQLRGVFTSIPNGFQATAGQPAPLVAQIIDDCGNTLDSGTVVVAFSSGDPAVPLLPLGAGQWSATWTPRKAAANNAITLQAVSQAGLFGVSTIASSVAANATTPLVDSGGVISAASGLAPVAPGEFIAIYGQNMGTGLNTSQPTSYSNLLGGTQVLIGGQPVPLYFTATGQIDAIVPYDLPTNTVQQLIVQNGLAYSQPEPVTIAVAQPGVFTQNQSGSGPGAILGQKPGGVPALNTAANPASAGDALLIFCTGLGTTSPAVPAGTAAPTSSLSYTTQTATATVGGQNAQILFAGLAPGYVGLYQVNLIVPTGVAAGPSVPVVITAAGAASATVTVAIR